MLNELLGCDSFEGSNGILPDNEFNFIDQRNRSTEKKLRKVLSRQEETIIKLQKNAIIAENQHAIDTARNSARLWQCCSGVFVGAVITMYMGYLSYISCTVCALICVMIIWYLLEGSPESISGKESMQEDPNSSDQSDESESSDENSSSDENTYLKNRLRKLPIKRAPRIMTFEQMRMNFE